MAYQSVGTPRFYINLYDYMKDNLKMDFRFREEYQSSILGLSPENQKENFGETILFKWASEFDRDDEDGNPVGGWGNEFKNELGRVCDSSKFYFAILNHNSGGKFWEFNDFADGLMQHSFEEVINCSREYAIYVAPERDGFSIFTLDLSGKLTTLDEATAVFNGFKITPYGTLCGAICFGSYYDIVSPSIDLSMEIEFDGYEKIKTINGSTLVNSVYSGAPFWNDLLGNKFAPWTVGGGTTLESSNIKRKGRRIWNLKFTKMLDKNLFSSNYSGSTYLEPDNFIGYDPEVIDDYNPSPYNTLVNGDFADSTVSNTNGGAEMVGWSNRLTHDSNSYFAINSFICHIVDNLNIKTQIYQDVLVDGVQYLWSIDIVEYIAGGINIRAGSTNLLGANVSITESTSGVFTHSSSGQYGDNFFKVESAGVTDIHFDNVRLSTTNPTDFEKGIGSDSSFEAQVLNRVSHGEKFIFQPDNNASNPSDFAIAILDQKSFKRKQVAPNVYDISMKIKEVW